jgi:hypothetical protein
MATHFNASLDQSMREWYTTERVCGVLRQCEQAGVNTWQISWNPRTLPDVKQHRAGGGNLQVVLIGFERLVEKDPAQLQKLVAEAKPIGIAHAGVLTDVRFRNGKPAKCGST